MALKASEISQLIKERIENFEASAEARDVGTVIAVTDGIVRIHGLADARYGEMLEFPGNTFGLALNLDVRVMSDQGTPIVPSQADSAEALKYREMAAELAAGVGAGAPQGSAYSV